ncbi:MAG TPA: PaaI family thioesterase [Mycobacterium sp.]|nr:MULTISPECIES: PaaI family thioesterase [Rhodococcus]UOT08410.1 PaaI family thioesterase [Rhodococcus opacus]HJT92366.1 PaaI family thioesterase [Mycobacterium sp.]
MLGQWWGRFHQHHPTVRDGDELPPHHSWCLGCGPDNPHGHHLHARRRGEGVVAEHVFDDRHMGAPGIAHGGAVTTVLDDMFGMLLYTVGEMAVTRRLDTEFHAPVLLGTRYVITADLQRRRGRKLDVTARMEVATTGDLAASARALFIVVDLAHFTTSLTRAQSTTDIDQDLP